MKLFYFNFIAVVQSALCEDISCMASFITSHFRHRANHNSSADVCCLATVLCKACQYC